MLRKLVVPWTGSSAIVANVVVLCPFTYCNVTRALDEIVNLFIPLLTRGNRIFVVAGLRMLKPIRLVVESYRTRLVVLVFPVVPYDVIMFMNQAKA